MANRNELLRERAELQEKLKGYLAQGPNATEVPLMQQMIETTKREINHCTTRIDAIGALTGYGEHTRQETVLPQPENAGGKNSHYQPMADAAATPAIRCITSSSTQLRNSGKSSKPSHTTSVVA